MHLISITKVCTKCKIEKPLEEFNNLTKGVLGKKEYCKECGKLYYQANRDKFIALQQVRYIEHKEEIIAYSTQHRKDNKVKYNKLERERAFKKRHSNINVRIKHNLSSALGLALKKQNATKNSRIVQLLGCSIAELKVYLENQFVEGMSWSNYGQWHIDHIKPCAAFDLTIIEEQQLCFYHTNLQPLWAKDNIKKSSIYEGTKHKHDSPVFK